MASFEPAVRVGIIYRYSLRRFYWNIGSCKLLVLQPKALVPMVFRGGQCYFVPILCLAVKHPRWVVWPGSSATGDMGNVKTRTCFSGFLATEAPPLVVQDDYCVHPGFQQFSWLANLPRKKQIKQILYSLIYSYLGNPCTTFHFLKGCKYHFTPHRNMYSCKSNPIELY